MAQAFDIEDVDHTYGGDLALSSTGDLGRVSKADRSKQHVLRRLLTNPGDYLAHVTYGGGIPQRVGTVLNLAETQGAIRGQMLLESSVVSSPEPVVTAEAIPNGVNVRISYAVAPERTPAALAFNVRA